LESIVLGEHGLWSLVQILSFELSEDPPEFIFDQINKLCYDARIPQEYKLTFICFISTKKKFAKELIKMFSQMLILCYSDERALTALINVACYAGP
jgi:hypothetical protein